MFSEVDNIIFPDSCEVIQTSSQQFVFPIFKNGSSSLTITALEKKWKYLSTEEIKLINEPITVILRDPKERFISGVNTYIQHLNRDTPGLDTDTILYFINRYLFLNRHYCPQFFWLINLLKYINPTARLRFCSMSDLASFTDINLRAFIEPITEELLLKIEKFNWNKLELYFFLDQILIDSIGKTLTIDEIFTNIKTNHPELYKLIFANTLNIINVLP